jgi:hypothetical protein
MTCLVYWDAGHGRAALERLDQDWKAQLESVTNNPLLLLCPDGQTGSMGSPSPPTTQQVPANPGDASAGKTQLELAKGDLDCKRFNYTRWLSENAGKEVKRVFECDGHYSFVHAFCWRWLLSGHNEPNPSSNRPPSSSSNRPPSSSSNQLPYGEMSPYVKDNANVLAERDVDFSRIQLVYHANDVRAGWCSYRRLTQNNPFNR